MRRQPFEEDQEPRREVAIREADRAQRAVLWLLEAGRCYCCAGEASDVAHLISRRYLRLRWDTAKDGNCHLLCRICHTEDHAGNLQPSYMDVFVKRMGEGAMDELIVRQQVISPLKDFEIEDVVRRLNKQLEELYAKGK
jgi:hypothetical protein